MRASGHDVSTIVAAVHGPFMAPRFQPVHIRGNRHDREQLSCRMTAVVPSAGRKRAMARSDHGEWIGPRPADNPNLLEYHHVPRKNRFSAGRETSGSLEDRRFVHTQPRQERISNIIHGNTGYHRICERISGNEDSTLGSVAHQCAVLDATNEEIHIHPMDAESPLSCSQGPQYLIPLIRLFGRTNPQNKLQDESRSATRLNV